MQAYALTDVGKVRSINQDYLFSSSTAVGPLKNLYLVADGMGGHKAGDYASRFIVEHLVEFIRQQETSSVVSILKDGIGHINYRLYQQSLTNPNLSGMGSTLVAAVIEQRIAYVANIGDSRLYLIRDGIKQITKDHSYVEELVALGKLKRNSPDYQERKNIITRAVGTRDNVNIDFFEIVLKEGDFLLLCSDGLTNMVEDEQILEIIRSEGSLKEKAQNLIAAANQNGGKDNIAVVLIEPQVSEVCIC